MSSPHELGVAAARSALAEARLSADELWAALGDRARSCSSLNAFVEVCDEPPRWREGPLGGVPLAIKDLFTDGPRRPTAGSRVTAEAGAPAAILRRLRSAGAGVLGYTNLHEWAVGLTSAVTASGPIGNPLRVGAVAGGSSGGSAAAVAVGAAPAAIGTDAGGSIRCPAACCGIVGFKPSFGSVPFDGYVAAGAPVDHIGCLTRNVSDARLVFEVLSDQELVRPEVGGLRVGIARRQFFERAHAEVGAALEAALEALTGLAGYVDDVEIAGVEAAGTALPLIYLPHVSELVGALEGYPEQLRPETRHLLDLGRALSKEDRAAADAVRATLARAWAEVFEQVDVVVTPTLPYAPPDISASPPDLDYLPFTAPMNLGGVPALALPCGETSSWWTPSITLSAAAGNDAVVLALGDALEQRLDRAYSDRVVEPPTR